MVTASGSFLLIFLLALVLSLFLSRKKLFNNPNFLLFSLTSFIWLYSFNPNRPSFIQLAILLSFIILINLLSLIFKNLFLRLLFLTSFIIYGHLYIFLRARFIGDFRPGVNSYLMVGFLATWLAAFLLQFKTKVLSRKRINQTIIAFSHLFFLLSILVFGFNLFKYFKKPPVASATDKPDVYYLIFDEYPRADVLKEQFSFDNSDLIKFLEAKGFFVASQSKANYPITFLSVSSALSMNYVNYFADLINTDTRNASFPYQLIDNNPVKQFFKSKGYQIIDFSNRGWNALRTGSQHADQDLFSDDPYYFLKTYLSTTILNPFFTAVTLQPYLPESIRPNDRQLVLTTFEKLKAVPDNPHSTFTFAHVFIPHFPYYFDSQGNPAQGDIITPDRQKFLDQLVFANQQIKQIITAILDKSDQPPIIILQSDTGPGFYKTIATPFKNLTSEQIQERFPVLNAYYLPDGGQARLYDTISPVNSFRLILSDYFDQNYPLLQDQSYFATYQFPYRFYPIK